MSKMLLENKLKFSKYDFYKKCAPILSFLNCNNNQKVWMILDKLDFAFFDQLSTVK